MSPIPIRTILAVCALALPIPAAVAGCGDDEASDEDPQTVLDETFGNEESVASGNLSLSASASAEGQQGGSFEASLSGPFQGDPDDPTAIPQLDFTASASGDGAGQAVEFDAGLTITEDNAYIEFRDEAYEIGTEQFAQLKEGIAAQTDSAESAEESSASFGEICTQSIEQAGGDPAACEVDFASWLTNLTNEGTEDVGGAETVHISGDADTQQILTDIGEFIGAIPGTSSQTFDPAQLGVLSGVVTEASIDVYSGVDDNLLRKLEANLAIDPSALGIPVQIGVVDTSLSFEIADLNEEQTVEAPADARPIEELTGGLPFDVGSLPLPGGGAETEKCLEDAQTARDLEQCLE